MIKIATPVSHLFADEADAQQIIAHSDVLECRDHSFDVSYPGQELFHCEKQLIHEFFDEDWQYIDKVIANKKELTLFSFHAASSCDDPILKDNMFQPNGKQYSRDEMLNNAANNIKVLKEKLGNDRRIAIENNNYYPTDAYQLITDPDFISEVVNKNDIWFLFDMAHAKVSAHNRKMDFETYMDGLPLDRAIQLHIAKHGINDENMAYDAHLIPEATDLLLVKEILENNRQIKYITMEYYKDTNNLVSLLKQLKNMVNGISR